MSSHSSSDDPTHLFTPEELQTLHMHPPQETISSLLADLGPETDIHESDTIHFGAKRTMIFGAKGDAIPPPSPPKEQTQKPTHASNSPITAHDPEVDQSDRMKPSDAPGKSEWDIVVPKDLTVDFYLQQRIGEGGQGEVWRAFQSSLRREVAVKRLIRGSIREFLQEAFTTGELEHPNIVPVHELTQTELNGRLVPVLAMKLVRGRSWREVLDSDRKAEDYNLDHHLARHLAILISVCNAVSYAHSKGIIHRDLKPAQVMLGEFGEVYLMDWGLAVSRDTDVPVIGEKGLTKFRTLGDASNCCGTPAYMAPEQTERNTRRIDIQTDVYLLGAILYCIVTGRPPHDRESAVAAFIAARANEIPPPSLTVPKEIRDILKKALANHPEDRHQTVAEFRQAIEGYLSGAGRRSESEAVTHESEIALQQLTAAPTYDGFVAVEQQISRALTLWGDNPKALWLREQLRVTHCEFATRVGDLAIARSLARGVFDGTQRDELLREIDQRERGLSAHKRQRRLLLAILGTITLGIIVSLSFLIVTDRETTRRQLSFIGGLKSAAEDFAKTLTALEQDPNVDPAVKHEAWERYVRTFQLTGHEIALAEGRRNFWANQRGARGGFTEAETVELGDAVPAEKEAAWRRYLSQHRAAAYRLAHAEERAGHWQQQAAMEDAYAAALARDADPALPAEEKIRAWEAYLRQFGQEAHEADDARGRITGWRQLGSLADANAWVEAIEADPMRRPGEKIQAWHSYQEQFGPRGADIARAEERIRFWSERVLVLSIGGGQTISFVPIPAGEFDMGSPDTEANRDPDEGPVTRVVLARPFWISETEVTQAQWQAVMGSNPSRVKGASLPAESVTWSEAMNFARQLSSLTGRRVRLPTEAQWEYAARIGQTGAPRESEQGWHGGNSGGSARPVATSPPNTLGVFDLSGNVFEWCQDYAGAAYPGGRVSDPTGPLLGEKRAVRGGSFETDAKHLRPANRAASDPSLRYPDIGLRVVIVEE